MFSFFSILGTVVGTGITWIAPLMFWVGFMALGLRLFSYLFVIAVESSEVVVVEHTYGKDPVFLRPGSHINGWMLAGNYELHKIDCREQQFEYSHLLACETTDGTVINVTPFGTYVVSDPERMYLSTQNAVQLARALLAVQIKNAFAQHALSSIPSSLDKIADTVLRKSNLTCKKWGITIQEVRLSFTVGQVTAKANDSRS